VSCLFLWTSGGIALAQPGNVGDPVSYTLVGLWFIGAVILGVGIAYGVVRAGRLRRAERRRLDQATGAVQREEDSQK
jgi:hypothetical protein